MQPSALDLLMIQTTKNNIFKLVSSGTFQGDKPTQNLVHIPTWIGHVQEVM